MKLASLTRIPAWWVAVAIMATVLAVPAGAGAASSGGAASEAEEPSEASSEDTASEADDPGEPASRKTRRGSLEGDATAFNRPGMWIWYLERSHGGNYERIIRQARRAGIGTLYIKSADGTNVWSQFTRDMVNRFQQAGLRVCGWHYVYGDEPVQEARASAVAARRGADCFVIDAEAQYRGKYAAADRYIRVLRRHVGFGYPVALTSFPYVDYHPGFPYSVFLGIGGAQVNKPQMYWKTIGTTVRDVFDHTYLHNRLFRRPIRPLGQTYLAPTPREVVAFRRLTETFGAVPSWWSWQGTEPRGWFALAYRAKGAVPDYPVVTDHATLRHGSRGDMVVWAQQHLKGSVAPNLPVTGNFLDMTEQAVRSFQSSHDLEVDGVLGTSTWGELLKVRPVRTSWWVPPRKARQMAAASYSSGSGPGISPRDLRGGIERAPRSADLPSKGFELGAPPPK